MSVDAGDQEQDRKGTWSKLARWGGSLVVILALLALAHVGIDIFKSANRQEYPVRAYNPARDAIVAAPGKDGKMAAEAHEPYCNAPGNEGDADLCAQWAAVQSVEEGNRLTRISLWVSLGEAIGLTLSLFFTGWAALAASKAAKIAEESMADADQARDLARQSTEAAVKSAEIAQAALSQSRSAVDASTRSAQAAEKAIVQSHEQYVNSHRPYLSLRMSPRFVKNGRVERHGKWVYGHVFLAEAELKNLGKVPATDIKHIMQMYILVDGTDIAEWDDSFIDKNVIPLAPGDDCRLEAIQILEQEYDAVGQGKARIIYRAAVQYTDPLSGRTCQTITVEELVVEGTYDRYVNDHKGVVGFAVCPGVRMT
ncbi:hypothetical protein SAMN05518849_101569 [Sphingobium sp. AP50]|uniref:hypothetical protein n=1 Tax=Sphingobium sp. AP50 TaxID=1884369 RepID=UPI0008C7612F|nr:hypothetical protein [Sphingobium sp. AP50]SEI69053.1 hypothetical protein SAMN05518849_101569 [Sphingobium sp. AP50]